MTVLETARFLKDAKPLMSDSEREELVVFVGANPEAGEIIPETGGVQKDPLGLAGPRQARRSAGDLLLPWTNDFRCSSWPLTERTRRRTSAGPNATR
jgi:hypothetical protein